MITEKAFNDTATRLGVEVAAIKAVAEVESSGSGFLASGEPLILFEPHIFYKELKKKGLDPEKFRKGNEDILYPKWGEKPYGKTGEQHARLEKAIKIDREAALASASWGKFQILGNNFKLAGKASIQEFINDIYRSEDAHLDLFANFIKNAGLVKYLKDKNWAKFADGYNGSGYAKNQYDKKLEVAYKKYKSSN